MAKHASSTARGRAETAAGTRSKQTRRRIARLEKQLDRLSGQVARRSRRLSRAQERAVAVEQRLRDLRSSGPSEHHAYCLRDRRVVTILDAQEIALGNGRPALSGRCELCGSRVVTMIPRSEAS